MVLLRGVSLVGNPIAETDVRASSRLFPHVALMQYSETTTKSSTSINQMTEEDQEDSIDN